MVRKFGNKAEFVPVTELTHDRIDINFDMTPIDGDDAHAYWSKHSYFSRPTTGQMQEDVIKNTTQRYINEGLEPPRPEDIDVTPYVID